MEKHDRPSGRALTRREWVQRMLAGAGAGIAAPGFASTPSAQADPTAVPIATAAPAGPAIEWKTAFFDHYQNLLVIALAGRIVPGSSAVQVNRFIDAALAAETREVQQKFICSMNALEGECLRQFTKSFCSLSSPQQEQVLHAASTGNTSEPTTASEEEDAAVHEPEPTHATLRDYFDYLKSWVSMAYYSSEVGMKELGWTGENFFTTFPGCQHAGSHS